MLNMFQGNKINKGGEANIVRRLYNFHLRYFN